MVNAQLKDCSKTFFSLIGSNIKKASRSLRLNRKAFFMFT